VTLYLSSDDVRALCSQEIALDAARGVLAAEQGGRMTVPPRYDIDLPNGFFRVMPAAVGDHVGLKVMTLAKGIGNRYLLLLYSQKDGDLVAVLDADEVTRLRTAATTAAAASVMRPEGVRHLAIIGTGFEAAGHLRAFASLWDLDGVLVYSRSAEKRQAFAADMSAELGISVEAVSSSREAVTGVDVTVLCTKSPSPVIDGHDFREGATVLSIGSTRLDLRELDVETLRRSSYVLVDDVKQVLLESGDIQAAIETGALSKDQLVPVAMWDPQKFDPDAGKSLLTFKSVGTAVQDLLLASELVESAVQRGIGRELGELAGLKKGL
jgi:alanine dehydrogenase